MVNLIRSILSMNVCNYDISQYTHNLYEHYVPYQIIYRTWLATRISSWVMSKPCNFIIEKPAIIYHQWLLPDHIFSVPLTRPSIILPYMLCLKYVIIQYTPRNMQTVFALLCFVVVIHWLISPYPSGLLHWHCGNLTIAPVPAKQPWWIWINTSCEFVMNDYITTTKQSTTKPCAYFLWYTVQAYSLLQLHRLHNSSKR